MKIVNLAWMIRFENLLHTVSAKQKIHVLTVAVTSRHRLSYTDRRDNIMYIRQVIVKLEYSVYMQTLVIKQSLYLCPKKTLNKRQKLGPRPASITLYCSKMSSTTVVVHLTLLIAVDKQIEFPKMQKQLSFPLLNSLW